MKTMLFWDRETTQSDVVWMLLLLLLLKNVNLFKEVRILVAKEYTGHHLKHSILQLQKYIFWETFVVSDGAI